MERIFSIFFVLVFCTQTVQECWGKKRDDIDSLQKALSAVKKEVGSGDTLRAHIMLDLAAALLYPDRDSCRALADHALEISRQREYQRRIARCYQIKAGVSALDGQIEQSITYYLQASQIAKSLSANKLVADIHANLASAYSNQGDFPRAIDFYFKALNYFEQEEKKDFYMIAYIMGNLGVTYKKLRDYEKAKSYLLKALDIGKETHDTSIIATHLSNLGNVHLAEAKDMIDRTPAYRDSLFYNALNSYKQALEMNIKSGRKREIGINLGNIGIVYQRKGNWLLRADQPGSDSLYKKALDYYLKALAIAEELKVKQSIAIWHGNIGTLYYAIKDIVKTEAHLLKALEISKTSSILHFTKYCHEQLSQLYEETSRPKEALIHYKEFSSLKDSLFNEQKSKEIGKLEAKHEFETAEMDRKRIEEEQAKQEAAAKSRRDNLQYSGILIFLVILCSGLLALGKFAIPVRLAEGMIFFTFLLLFEFLLVMLDPYIEGFSGGAPAYKLMFNAVLAGLIFPMHSFFERKLKKNLAKHE